MDACGRLPAVSVFSATQSGRLPGADPGLGNTVIQNMSAGHTYTFSPDGAAGWTSSGTSDRIKPSPPTTIGQNFGQILGIPGLNGPDIRQSGFPNINFNDLHRHFGRPELDAAFRIGRELHDQPQPDLDEGRSRVSLRIRRSSAALSITGSRS